MRDSHRLVMAVTIPITTIKIFRAGKQLSAHPHQSIMSHGLMFWCEQESTPVLEWIRQTVPKHKMFLMTLSLRGPVRQTTTRRGSLYRHTHTPLQHTTEILDRCDRWRSAITGAYLEGADRTCKGSTEDLMAGHTQRDPRRMPRRETAEPGQQWRRKTFQRKQRQAGRRQRRNRRRDRQTCGRWTRDTDVDKSNT